PLAARGLKENHVISFARSSDDQAVIVATGRFFTRLGDAKQLPLGSKVWGDTVLVLSQNLAPGLYRDVLTGQQLRSENNGGEIELPLARVFAHLPLALLERVEEG